tara:strand:+ start:4473 stop:8015 length:3543 start_codon:yes stop_codon:yes gene_type:complete
MTNIDIGQASAALPAYIKSITLSHGDYTVGAGSALAPGSYSLEANNQNLFIGVDVCLKQFVDPLYSPLRAKNARAELADKLNIMVVATTSRPTAEQLQSDPSQLISFLTQSTSTQTQSTIISFSEAVDLMGDGFSDASVAQYSNTIGLDIPFNTSFVFPGQSNPDYLCLFAVSFIDTNDDDNINFISPTDVVLGNAAVEVVIKDAVLHTKSTLFYHAGSGQSEATLYIGPVHQDRNNHWRTGPTAAPGTTVFNGDLLTTKIAYNSKIADHRGVSRIERLQLGLNNVSAFSSVSGRLRSRMDSLASDRKESMNYLSDVLYAKDENNNLKLFFSLDYASIIKNNALYASLCQTSLSELISTCTMLSLKVIRRRINEPNIFNRLTGGDSPNRIYDDKIDVVGQPIGIPLGVANPGILHFYTADHEIDKLTTGLYEYGIEMEVLDLSKNKIMNILTDPNDGLQGLVAELEQFLSWSLMKGNYDVASNRYTKQFLTTINTTYSNPTTSDPPWTAAVLKYIGAITLLFGPQYSVGGLGTPTSLMNELLTISDPTTSGPTGIQFLIRLLNNFVSSLRTVLGADGQATSSHRRLPSLAPISAFSQQRRIFSIRQFFTTAFDADNLINLGIDMLNIGPNPVVPPQTFKFLTYDAWRQVATVESSKLQTTNPVVASAGDATFLTPNFLRIEGSPALNLYNAYLSEKSDLEQVGSVNVGSVQIIPEHKIIDANGNSIIVPRQEIVTKPLTEAGAASYVATELEVAFYRLLESGMTKNSPINLSNKTVISGKPPAGMSNARVLVAQNKAAVMNVNSCVATTLAASVVSPITYVFTSTPFNLSMTSEDPTEPLDAMLPLSPTSKFVSDAGEVIDASSGSNSAAATLEGSDASAGNSTNIITANSSVVGNFLLQTDFFQGSLASSSPMKRASGVVSLNAGSGLKSNNMSIAQYAETNKAAQMASKAVVTSTNNLGVHIIASTGKPAAIASQIQFRTEAAIPSVAPQEEEFVQAAQEGNLDPSKIVLTALRYGFIYKTEYLASYAVSVSSGNTLIKEPVWLGLSLEVVRAAEQAGKVLLCRLRKHSTLLKSFEGLKLPIYNKHFLIGPSGAGNQQFMQLPTANPTVSPAPAPADLLASMVQYADSIDFASSYDTSVGVGSAPDPIQEYLLGSSTGSFSALSITAVTNYTLFPTED